MRSYFAPAAIAMIMPAILSARFDDIPTLDVNAVCPGIASRGGVRSRSSVEQFGRVCRSSSQTSIGPKWLGEGPASEQELLALLKPCPDDDLKIWPVDKWFANVKNNRPQLVLPVLTSEVPA